MREWIEFIGLTVLSVNGFPAPMANEQPAPDVGTDWVDTELGVSGRHYAMKRFSL